MSERDYNFTVDVRFLVKAEDGTEAFEKAMALLLDEATEDCWYTVDKIIKWNDVPEHPGLKDFGGEYPIPRSNQKETE